MKGNTNPSPASARTHIAQALDPYSDMKLFGNRNKDYTQSYHSLYKSISRTLQARPLAGLGFRWLAIALLLSLPSLAAALQTDKDQATYIEADSVDIDDRKGISIYKGHVELTQGSIRINADKIVVTQKQGSSDHIVATGKPVTFQQKMDGNKGMVKGRSNKAEYDVDSEILYMIDKAVLTQGKDSFKSDRITYDRAKAIVKAGASAKGKQRVRVTIGGKSSKK